MNAFGTAADGKPFGRRPVCVFDDFAAETGGLRLTDLGPLLLAADPDHLLIVMEDLGDAPNLADLLLSGDEKQARAALIEWATTYGRLAVPYRDEVVKALASVAYVVMILPGAAGRDRALARC